MNSNISFSLPSLESYLIEERKNLDNFKLLINNFRNLKPVTFVGAGVSTSLGISDWKNLTEDLFNLSDNQENLQDLFENPNLWQELAESIKRN